MSNIIRFVEPDLTTVRLTVDYIEDMTDIPLPDNTKNWAYNDTDGAELVDSKYENINLTLAFKLHGVSKADLGNDVSDLLTEITRDNILEVQLDSGDSFFYDTYAYDQAEAHSLIKRCFRKGFIVHPFLINLKANYAVRGDEEELDLIENLFCNWSFEDRIGNNFDCLTETAVNGAGVATLEAYTLDKVFGDVSLHLKITAGGGGAEATVITTNFIDINYLSYYHFVYNAKAAGGTVNLDATIKQYDNLNNHIPGADIVDNPTGTGAWELEGLRINRFSLPAPSWHADCRKVKIEFSVNGAAAEWFIDGVTFTNSDYLRADGDHMLANPCSVTIPNVDLKGDIPAPCDIFFAKFGEDVAETTALYFGAKANPRDDFCAFIQSETVGTPGTSNMAFGGAYRSLPVGNQLILNNSLDTVVGVVGSNAETWNNWTDNRGTGYMVAVPGPLWVKHGDYSIQTVANTFPGPDTVTLTSDLTAVNIANDHLFFIWYMAWIYSGVGRFLVEIECYDAVPALTGTLTVIDTKSYKRPWTLAPLQIDAADWPALTTQVRVKITAVTGWQPQDGQSTGDIIFWDYAYLKEGTPFFEGDEIIGHLGEYVIPFLHYKSTVAQQNRGASINGRVSFGALNWTDWSEIDESALDMKNVWTFQRANFKPFQFPNYGFSDNADIYAFTQGLQLVSGENVAAATMYTDIVALLPCDNGWAVIESEDNQYLFLDSRSRTPRVLATYGDSILGFIIPEGSIKKGFTLDPQNGTNLGGLLIWTDDNGNQLAQWLADIKIKYWPYYLVAR